MDKEPKPSQREEEVIALLLQGKSNKQIALLLSISERTVEFHLKNIYEKYRVNSRVELILKLGKSTGDLTKKPVESTVEMGGDQIHNGKKLEETQSWAKSLLRGSASSGKEFAMSKQSLTILGVITVVLGIGLIVGGILTGKAGAVVVGLCVSAGATTLLFLRRKQKSG